MTARPESPSILIIGGGPAGLSCGLWLKNMGMEPLILEKGDHLGGSQLDQSHENNWLLGLPRETGQSLAKRFAAHVRDCGVAFRLGENVSRLEQTPSGWAVCTAASETIESAALVLAMGSRPRGAEDFESVPGGELLSDPRWASLHPGDVYQRGQELSGRRVCVIGGGDNAFKTALFAAERASFVEILVRSQVRADTHHQRAVDQALKAGKARVRQHVQIVRFERQTTELRLWLQEGGQPPFPLSTDLVFLRTGYRPNVSLAQPWIADRRLHTDKRGCLVTNRDMQTSLPGVYAIGELTASGHPCVATAIAEGAAAARTIEENLRQPLF